MATFGRLNEQTPILEQDHIEEELIAALDYLGVLTPQFQEKLRSLIAPGMRLLGGLHRERESHTGLQTVMMSEGAEGLSGTGGNYWLQYHMPESGANIVPTDSAPRLTDQRLRTMLERSLQALAPWKDTYIPPLDWGKQSEIVRRTSVDPTVRLVVPCRQIQTENPYFHLGYVDVPLSVVQRALEAEAVYIEGNTDFVSPLESFLLQGYQANGTGELTDLVEQIKPLESWYDGRTTENAPWLVLGIHQTGNYEPNDQQSIDADWQRVGDLRDPQILSAVVAEVESVVQQPNRRERYLRDISIENGHTAINGLPLQELWEKRILVDELSFDVDKLSHSIDLVETGTERCVRFNGSISEKFRHLAVGPDQGAREIVAALNMEEVIVELGLAPEIEGYLFRDRKQYSYGGKMGLWAVASLLTSGQAPFLSVATREQNTATAVSHPHEGDLQMALGLGGAAYTSELRSCLDVMRDLGTETDEGKWEARLSHLETKTRLLHMAAGFWDRMNQQYLPAYRAEIARAQAGHGTPTFLASMAGSRMRGFAERIAGMIVPPVEGMMESRFHLSKLPTRAKFVTAVSRTLAASVGISDNWLTGRYEVRDPLLLAEAWLKSTRHETFLDRAQAVAPLPERGRSVRTDRERRANELFNIWLAKCKEVAHLSPVAHDQRPVVDAVEIQFFPDAPPMTMLEFLRHVGSTQSERLLVLDVAKAMRRAILSTIHEERAQVGSPNPTATELGKAMAFLARQKTVWLVLHALELQMFADLSAAVLATDEERRRRCHEVDVIQKYVEVMRGRLNEHEKSVFTPQTRSFLT